MLDQYEAYIWTAHGRFPTNTPGWWGGAHPFNILDWSIVHNGEISSYDTNRRYIEQFGYICTMQTDTEVITYLFDHLLRHHNLPIEVAAVSERSLSLSLIARSPLLEPRITEKGPFTRAPL